MTQNGSFQHLSQPTTGTEPQPIQASTLWLMPTMSPNRHPLLTRAKGEPISRDFEALADISSVPYSNAQARPSFHTNYPPSFSGQFDMQRPVQGTHVQISQAPTPITLDYSQQWNPVPSHGRQTSHTLLYDQDPSRYDGSYITHTGASVQNVVAEGSSVFPGLSPLVTHLPAHGGNRTLPVPMNIHSSFDSSNGSMQGSVGEAGLYQQHLETGPSQRSVSSASQDVMTATGQSSSTSSSPSENQEMSALDFISIAQTSPNASSETTSGFHFMDTSNTNNVGSYAASPRSVDQHSNSQLPSLNSPFDGYSGHRGPNAPDRAPDSAMAIRNGHVYDPHGRPRILQPQPRRSPSYDLLKGSFEGSGKHPAKVLKANGHGRRPDGKH